MVNIAFNLLTWKIYRDTAVFYTTYENAKYTKIMLFKSKYTVLHDK